MTNLTLDALTCAAIARALAPLGASATGAGDRPLGDVRIDSREVTRGDVFVALPGERVDGNDFIDDAIARGAAAVIASRTPAEPAAACVFVIEDPLAALQALGGWWRRQFDLPVVAITGSVGKTTTKELIAGLLASRYRTLKNAGNQNNEIGVPLTMLSIRPGHERVVTEMGMYQQGEIRGYCEIALPSVGVVTTVRPIHLDRVGSIEGIEAAKRELPEALPADGLCVLNADDPRVLRMASATRARVLTYGIDHEADVRALELRPGGADGTVFTLAHGGAQAEVFLRLPGRHQVANALAAAAVALADGFAVADVAALLGDARDELRLRVVRGKRGSTILDDTYNAGPDSVSADLAILADCAGRKVAVLGDMLELGSIEIEAHRAIGRQAAGVVDLLYTVGPRARHIAEAAREAGLARVRSFDSKDGVVEAVLEELQAGDFVLVKASHSVALETVAAALYEEGAA